MRSLLNLFLTMLVCSSVFSQESVFGFKGRVLLGFDRGNDVTVSLFEGNQKISSYQTGRNGKFIIDAERNKHYTLQLEKEGFLTKRIIIDTHVNERDAWGVKEFKFDVSLLKKEEEIDYSDLDFPIAIIEFEQILREFSYNREYTSNMLELQDQILDKSTTIASN